MTAGLDHILPAISSLTPAQQTVLSAVSSHENPVTVADLARECGLHVNTVREPLAVLRSLGLVERERMPASGRGRPAWGYLSRALSGVASSVDMLHHIARSTISWIRATASDPMAAGRELGHQLGDDALAAAKVPDHNAIDFPADFELANHMTKIRVLLVAYGLAAEPHPDLPTALVLRDSPFAEGDDPDPVAFAIRQGMVERIVERTARGTATPTFRSGPDPRVCEVILVPTGSVKPRSEPEVARDAGRAHRRQLMREEAQALRDDPQERAAAKALAAEMDEISAW